MCYLEINPAVIVVVLFDIVHSIAMLVLCNVLSSLYNLLDRGVELSYLSLIDVAYKAILSFTDHSPRLALFEPQLVIVDIRSN